MEAAILRTKDYPEFSSVTPDNAITGCAKSAIEYDVALGKHIDNLKDLKFPKNFSSVFDPIEQVSVPMNFTWRAVKNLSYVRGADGFRTAFQRVHPQVERAKNERWVSEPLYNAIKEVRADRDNLTEYQQRLADMYLLEARLNGIELDGNTKQTFIGILRRLTADKNHYRNKVMLSHNLFSHTIEDFSKIAELPKSLLQNMAADKNNPTRGPWKVTLQQNVYNPFMEYCSDRMERWNAWQAFNTRASIKQDRLNLSNHLIIKDIRTHRKDIAQLLGYENFAQMSMETKMAGSVENVMHMIDSLKSKFKPIAQEEIARLQKFAESEGHVGRLEMWDIEYWKRREREHIFKLDPSELAEYFPLPKVLEGVFKLCNQLFGITIKDCTNDADPWHEDVRFYKIYDDENGGSELSAFYLDPYSRPTQKMSGAWMESARERSELVGTKPLSYLNLSLAPPFSNRPCLLTFDEAATLFYEVGHGLQQLLTTVPYSEIAGQRNVEWDALQVVALVMSMFFLNEHTLSTVSSHYETGKPLDINTIKTALQVHRHMFGYKMMRELYFSAYDMEVYISDAHWYKAMRQVWDEFMPVVQEEDDFHPCSLTTIFADQYPAAYYSFKWSEMIAADVFRAFEEVGLEDTEKVAVVGRRFRDTFLSLGGGVPASEVFRRFRGRDPSQDALIKYWGTD